MHEKVLEDLGLTKTEVKIYLTLLKVGQTTTTPIIKSSGIHASKVYEYLEKLIQKGLVSYVIKANKKHFQAANPGYLKEFLREKQQKIKEQEKEIDSILPDLQKIQKEGNITIKSEVYEGLRGIKSFYEKALSKLKKGETSRFMGGPKIANEKIEGYLLDWHERRIKKGVKGQFIYDYNVRKYGKIREKMKYTEVRYLPPKIASPMWIEIAKDLVGIGCIKQDTAVVIAIEDKEIANGFLDYFKLVWNLSEN